MNRRSLPLLGTLLFLAACAPEAADSIYFDRGTPEELSQAEDIATEQLWDADGPAMGKDVQEVRVIRTQLDEIKMAHTKFQQLVDGVPVFGGEAIVHLSQHGKFTGMTDSLLDHVKVDTTPYYDADEAIDLAVNSYYDGWEVITDDPKAELWILRHEGKDHLVWKVQLQRLDESVDEAMPVMFIDAHTGDLVWTYNNLQSATCTGPTNYYGTVNVDCYTTAGTYYLEDTTELMGTFSYNTGTRTRSSVTSTSATYANSTAVAKNAFEAHYAIQQVYTYYLSTFGRLGIDGANGPGSTSSHGYNLVTSGTSYSRNYVNAYWDGTRMVYGDGDGVNSGSLTTIDIAGHELTHGVTQYEANLTYAGESGGLNESMSDVLGSMVERSVLGESSETWKVGEQTWTPNTAGDALRYMNDPALDGVSADYYTSTTGNLDVHYSSGVSNLAFYLLSAGGSHPRAKSTTVVTGIGADKAAQIWYSALANYMTSSTNFSGARTATLSAAAALYTSTSTEYTQVDNAWAAVGVAAAPPSTCVSTTYSSSLASRGTGYQPSSNGIAAIAGTHTVSLTGPSTADFDLYLQYKSGNSWVTAGSSTGTTSTESLSYSGSAATYRVKVVAYSGSGNYSVNWCKP